MASAVPPARGSVTLLLEQPYGGMGAINPTGHSAIYLDHVCAETPLRLRPCRPGELGSVISRYDDISGFDWVAIPLLPYLYAVETPEDIPQEVTPAAVVLLRNRYRRAHLRSIAPDDADGLPPQGNWYELIGSSFDRTIYGFQVDSTEEQDRRLIALLNDRRNVQRYNGAFRNCADFARVTLNRFYPHAVRRNFIADLGLSTPKSVARGITHYAAKHPETHLQVFVIPQVKGTLPRSHYVQGVAESLLTRYGVPLTLISPFATGAMFVAYLGQGRFQVPRNAPVLDLSASPLPVDTQRNVFTLQTAWISDQASPLTVKAKSEGGKIVLPTAVAPVVPTVTTTPSSPASSLTPTFSWAPASLLEPASTLTPDALQTSPAVPADLPGLNLPLLH